MVTKGKLKMALAAEKGIDFKKLKDKKKQKTALKRKRARLETESGASDDEEDGEMEEEGVEVEQRDESEPDDSEDDSEDESETGGAKIDLAALDDSDTSESSFELEARIERPKKLKSILKADASKAADNGNGDSDDDSSEDDSDIALSDLEDLSEEERSDLIPHQRLTINNATALLASLARIRVLTTTPGAPFTPHQSVHADPAVVPPTADSVPDVSDDLARELALYAQSLAAARLARDRLRAEGVPFGRPGDYFAEMVKDDGHMEKVRARLVEAEGNKRAAAEARKLRDAKKFGKQVMREKLDERQRQKKRDEEKIKGLKRKRQDMSTDVGAKEAELFDVGVDRELGGYASRRRDASSTAAARGRASDGPNKAKRQKKDAKYGFGGKKRNAKSGDALSSGDVSGFSVKKNRASSFGGRDGPGRGGGGAAGKGRKAMPVKPRLGKSRRKAAGGR